MAVSLCLFCRHLLILFSKNYSFVCSFHVIKALSGVLERCVLGTSLFNFAILLMLIFYHFFRWKTVTPILLVCLEGFVIVTFSGYLHLYFCNKSRLRNVGCI